MRQTCIKICGITTLEQALACVEMGVEWLGFNCYPPSPRYLAPEKILEMVQALPDSVTTVGVFVNETAEHVDQIMRTTGMTLAQLHGNESPEWVRSLQSRAMKAFRVSNHFQMDEISHYPHDLFLLDSYHPNLYGGTGEPFNWELGRKASLLGKLMLAGGLTPRNVAQAIQTVRPFGVDVCSGVESSPGVKDLSLVQTLVEQVKHADEA